MKIGYKKQILLLFLASLLGIFIGIFVMCKPAGHSLICQGRDYKSFDLALWIMSASLLFTLLPLYFLKEKVYKVWRKFAVVALPLMILWIISGSDSHDIFNILDDRESIAQTSAFLFVLISYSIIVYKSFKLRGK